MHNIPVMMLLAIMMTACGVEYGEGTGDARLDSTASLPTQTGYALTVSGSSSSAACLFDLEPVDGWSYQTPQTATIGVAAVELLRSVDDTNPHLLVGSAPAHAADLVEGTTFAQVDTGSIPEGTYTHMRIKLDYVDFEVSATGHMGGFSLPGALDVDYVLSDHDSEARGAQSQGEYVAKFTAAGMEVPQAGVRPVEYPPSYPEATVATDGGEYWVTLAVPSGAIAISHERPDHVDVDVQFCIDSGFAWAENQAPGHTDGVFDLDYDPAATERPMSMAVRGFTMTVN